MRRLLLPLIFISAIFAVGGPGLNKDSLAQSTDSGIQMQWVNVDLRRQSPTEDWLVVYGDACPTGWTATKLYDAYSKEEQDIGRSNLWHTGEEEAAFSDTAQNVSGLKHLCVKATNPDVTITSSWGVQACPSGMGYALMRDDSGTYTNNTEDRIFDRPTLHATNEGSFKGSHNYYVWCLGTENNPGITSSLQLRWASRSTNSPASVPSCNADETALLHSSKRQYNLNYGDFYGTPQETLCAKLTVQNVSQVPPPTVTLVANPSSISQGQSSTLTFSSTNATSCTGTNFTTLGATAGDRVVSPDSTTKYTVTCTGSGGRASAEATVTVNSSFSASCSVNPTSIPVGGSATWTATATGGNGVYTYSWSGTDNLTGTGPSVTKTYTTAGIKTASVTVTTGVQARSTPATTFVKGLRNLAAPTVYAQLQNEQELTDTIDEGGGGSGGYIGGGTVDGETGGPVEEEAGPATITVECDNSLTVGDPLPDLTAGAVAVSPSSPTAGQTVTLSATASNIGTTTSGSFPMLFQIYESGTLKNSAYGSGLAAGGSQVMTTTHTFASAGTYTVRACANYNTAWTAITTESRYDNNCGPDTTVTITDNPGPPLSCTVSSTAVAVGGSVTYTASGAGTPYTWTPSDGVGSYGTGSTAQRTFSSSGSYGMTVSKSGYTSGSCPVVAVGVVDTCTNATATISANPTRVREGQTTTLTWSASGIDGTCSITGPGVSQTVTAAACVVPQGTATPTINTQSVYRISCDGGQAVDEVVVNVIPRFIEF